MENPSILALNTSTSADLSPPQSSIRRPLRLRRITSRTNDPVTDYARRIVSGEAPACALVKLACERHLHDLASAATLGLVWSVEHVKRVLGFFSDVLVFPDGPLAGTSFVLQPWQVFIEGSLFGWRLADGSRRFRVAYIEVGKGNGKTPLAGGTALYMLTQETFMGAQCFTAATTRDQAALMFNDAVSMVAASEALQSRILVYGGVAPYSLLYKAKNSSLRPVSREHRGLDGKRGHYAGIDELHEHTNSLVADKMRLGAKNDPNALILEITNSGEDTTSVCYVHHDYSKKVLQGIIDNPQWFAYVCQLDEGDDWHDEKVWPKVNPNLDVSVSRAYLREQVREASGMPSKESLIKRLNFCVWVHSSDPWISKDRWDVVQRPLDLSEYQGMKCYLAVDLSGKTDLTALCLAFPLDSGEIHVFLMYFTPKDTLTERAYRDHVPYDLWADQGLLIAVPGSSIDYTYIASEITVACQTFNVVELAYDRYRMEDLRRELAEAGIDGTPIDLNKADTEEATKIQGLKLVKFGQGFVDMAPAVDEFETRILNRTVVIEASPVTNYGAASARIERDAANNRKFAKNKSTGRIDGIVCATMCVKRAASHYREIKVAGGIYSRRGVIRV